MNQTIERYIAYHKQIERRMDGSAGGVFGAFLETLVKDDYYFSGTRFNDKMQLEHCLTNNPEEIKSFSGFAPLKSNANIVFNQIIVALKEGGKVLFCGTESECKELKELVPSTENLILIDVITTGFIVPELFDKYIKEASFQYGEPVVNVRFINKEYRSKYAKRITLASGRTVYIKTKQSFDYLCENGYYQDSSVNTSEENDLQHRIGDITIGGYEPLVDNDGLGYTYISINTDKGKDLFEKSKKRLVVVSSNDEVLDRCIIRNKPSSKKLSNQILQDKSIDEIANSLKYSGIKGKLINRFASLYFVIMRLIDMSQLKLGPILKFIKYNFFTKGVKTDYKHRGYIFFAPHTAISFGKGATIELHGPLDIGVKRVRSAKTETRVWMQPQSHIIVHEHGMFGYGSDIEVYTGATLEIGNLFSNSDITIICGKHIKLGNTVNLAKGTTVRDTNGHLVALQGFKMLRPVEIGNHTWVCSNSTIMPGVTLGDGVIVGSDTYVTKNVLSFTMVQGNPAVEVAKPLYFRM